MSGSEFQRYVRAGALAAAGGALAVAVLNWAVDPLQFYRKAPYPPLLLEQKRYQLPGLAKHYDYDTVIVGTSVSENFHPRQVAETLGGRALNLAMQGASAREQRLALEIALRTGRVRRVLWEIHYEYLRGDPSWVAHYDGAFPFHFYDQNPLNDLPKYLLSVDTTKLTLKILLARLGLWSYQARAPEEVFSWHRAKKFGPASVRRAWQRAVQARPRLRAQLPEYAPQHLNGNFDQNVLPLLRVHPKVKFQLFFPPFLAAYYAHVQATAPELLDHMLENRRHIFEQTRHLPNVELFDFQSVPEWIFDLDGYCDLMHFNLRINEAILRAIRDGRYRMTDGESAALRALLASTDLSSWVRNHVE